MYAHRSLPKGPKPVLSPSVFSIINPVDGGNAFCTDKRAEKYIRQGRAVLVRRFAIRFVESDHRHRAAQISAEEAGRRVAYDRVIENGFIARHQTKGIPFIGDRELVYARAEKRVPVRGRNGRTRVIL